MMRLLVVVAVVVLGSCHAHDMYGGSCPEFTPMEGFDWDRFKNGKWYVIEKFDTSSRCFTDEFEDDADGFKSIVQKSVLTTPERLSIDNKYIYRGRLVSPSRAEPGRMIVRFPLNPIGPASFVIMDTDYNSYALLCTCQVINLFFLFTAHRRSCSILQRSPIRDELLSEQLHKIVNDQIPSEGGLPADHDFDIIDHTNCDYSDNDKGIQLDVDKFLGLGGQTAVEAVVGTVVDELAGGLYKDNPEKFKEEVSINAPIKRANPKV